jgi:carboxypeptidase T
VGRQFRHPLAVTRAHRSPSGFALVAAIVAFAATAAVPAGAGGPDFPAYDSLYHSYPEMVDEIHAVEDAHPDLVDVFSIGQSDRGREIWAAKVSDNVELDEDEPEVLFDAVHHGDEHMTLEQALFLFHTLVDDYGDGPKVTRLVDHREIWFVFVLNPDGAQYDLGGNPYRDWRKNRQPNPTSSHVGTDLNRNYDYRWGCCGGSSGNPASETYRGWEPFSAPEAQAMADFVDSRVVDGWQQIRAHITLHQNGELILWPYAYTRKNVAGTMTAADHDAFVDMAHDMAATNGYRPMQSSDWYITDGDEVDWMYGRHRIFSFTMELFPSLASGPNHYPADEKIAQQTQRNRAALLYLIDLAGCPYRASDTEVANCGPLYDDLEVDRGWAVDPFGEDTATGGGWDRGNPVSTSSNGPKQLGSAFSGSKAFVTGLPAGADANANDLDGETSVATGAIDLPADSADYGALSFRWYLAHSAGSSEADALRVFIVDTATDERTMVFEALGQAADIDASWQSTSVDLAPFAGRTIRILFVALDGGPNNLLEAGLDDIRIRRAG